MSDAEQIVGRERRGARSRCRFPIANLIRVGASTEPLGASLVVTILE